MAKIHQITHQIPNIAAKVNFFADYFEYLVEVIGKDNHLDIENHLSLVEKILWQLETNFQKCVPYISNYLDHPYLQRDDPFVKIFTHHKSLFDLFDQFRALPAKAKKKWLIANPDFKKKNQAFKRMLKKRMVSKALFEIISFLRCVHALSEHQTEIIYCTKIIVSEFLLNGHSKKDVDKVFEKIMSRDVWQFPFPKNISSDEQKINFLATRTFEQQFQGIFNLLKSKPQSLNFLYRVFGVIAPDDFVFQYKGVTFYSPKHKLLQGIVEKHVFTDEEQNSSYLLTGTVIAVVKLSYFSIDNVERIAKQVISEALVFFNGVLKASAYLDAGSYLTSIDMKIYHGVWMPPIASLTLDEFDVVDLKNNPYQFLKNISGPAKRHFLKYEHLFVKAMQSRSVEDFWQYLEALIPDNKNGENRIREVVASITLLDAEISKSRRIASKIALAIQPFSVDAKTFGMTHEQHIRYFNELQNNKAINFKRLRREVKHPFIEYLLQVKDTKWSKLQLKEVKQYYERMLLEAYSQRNAIIHTGEGYNKSLVGVNETLSWIVNNFRQVIFQSLRNHSSLSFNDLLEKEIANSNALLC